MIFVTGDCHGSFHKLGSKEFKESKEMTKDDIVIICGDFGAIWDNPESDDDRYWLNWLNDKPFTTVFCDGNHENYDLLNHSFETVDFHGGKAHKIRDSVYHLMRGEIFDFEGLKFFVFGGAASHDISGGILDRDDFETEAEFKRTFRQWQKERRLFRVNHRSWWKEEMPSDEEYANAEKNLASVGYKVDYVISHCAPQSIVYSVFTYYNDPPNRLTLWFDELRTKLTYKKWYFGHYHNDKYLNDGFTLLYDRIERIN